MLRELVRSRVTVDDDASRADSRALADVMRAIDDRQAAKAALEAALVASKRKADGAVFGVESLEALDEHALRRAYHAKAREHHPDKGGDPAAFRRLKDAYSRAAKRIVEPPGQDPAAAAAIARAADLAKTGRHAASAVPPRAGVPPPPLLPPSLSGEQARAARNAMGEDDARGRAARRRRRGGRPQGPRVLQARRRRGRGRRRAARAVPPRPFRPPLVDGKIEAPF